MKLVAVLAGVAITLGCAGAGAGKPPATVPEIRPGLLAGYLPKEAIPSSLALVPPPPAAGSAAFAFDEEVARARVAQRGTPRWNLAVADADLKFPQAAGTFSCALGAPVTQEQTPHLVMLLRRSLTDAGLSTYAAKDHYRRARPFMANNEPTCTPDLQAAMEKDGSYPSGHVAVGWAWALILSEIAPERAEALLARGLAFGESRSVCNVHWPSDLVAGRTMGAAVVARLHAEPAFRADLEAAKAELAAVRAKGLAPARDCTAEAEALGKGDVYQKGVSGTGT